MKIQHKERPINFKAHEVRATREGRKTQTRRVVKPQPAFEFHGVPFQKAHELGEQPLPIRCPYGKPGDRLWVRETFFVDHYLHYPKGRLPKEKPDWFESDLLIYAADGTCCQQYAECECEGNGAVWRPSIHMPRWASRITLEIVSVRVERLNDISEDDAKAEGCEMDDAGFPKPQPDASGIGHVGWCSAIEWYQWVWESINGPGSWDLNPWVWVVEFKEVK